jgi:hypothetical protein
MSANIAAQILADNLSLEDIAQILGAVEKACKRHGAYGEDVVWYIEQGRLEAEHGHELIAEEMEAA